MMRVNSVSTVTGRVQVDYDPLAYLPRTDIAHFAKGRIIYDELQHSNRLYAVVFGRVKLSFTTENGQTLCSRIVITDGLFGEVALVGYRGGESSTALDSIGLMSWPISEIEPR